MAKAKKKVGRKKASKKKVTKRTPSRGPSAPAGMDPHHLEAMQVFAGLPASRLREDYLGAHLDEVSDFEKAHEPYFGPGLAQSADPQTYAQVMAKNWQDRLGEMTYGQFLEVAGGLGYVPPEMDTLPASVRIGDLVANKNRVAAETNYRKYVKGETDPYEPTKEQKTALKALKAFEIVASATMEHKAVGLQQRLAKMVAEEAEKQLKQF